MPIDWNRVITVADEDTVDVIAGKEILYVRPAGEGGSSGTTEWGDITGTLSEQTDLKNALDAKASTAFLGSLAYKSTVNYSTEVTNKPTLGTMSAVNDAPSDSKSYARKNGAWSEVTGGTVGDYALSESIADNYDSSAQYSDGDLVMNNGQLCRVFHGFSEIESTELTASGSATQGDYLTYSGGLYIVTAEEVSWNSSTAAQAFEVLTEMNKIEAVQTSAYDPTATYTTGDIVSAGGKFYEYDGTSDALIPVQVVDLVGSGTTSWGNITGTLSNQTDLKNALDAKANTADLGSLADQDTVDYTTEVTNKPTLGTMSAVDDAPSNGNEYVRKNGAWAVASGGGGGGSVAWGSITGTLSDQTDLKNALDGKEDTLTFDSAPTSASTNPVTSGGVYTALSAKADTADLGDLAALNSIDYTSNKLTNKPTLGSLADQDTVDYATEVTNKPTLGDLAALNSIDYTSNYLTNKPTLGSLADQDTVDYATEVTNKPTLGTMAAVDDAPSDSKEYARKNGAWAEVTGGGGGGSWGSITGTLSDQTDLQDALDDKADVIITSASGAPATIQDGTPLPVESLSIEIVAAQAGSGTPTPTNIRQITGFTGATISYSGADTSDPGTLSVSWQTEAGTVYGGQLNVLTGALTVTHAGHVFTGSETIKNLSERLGWETPDDIKPYNDNDTINAICSHYEARSAGTIWSNRSTANYLGVAARQSGEDGSTGRVYWLDNVNNASHNATTFKTFLQTQYNNGTPVTVVWKLHTPISYTITPGQAFDMVAGENNVWTDVGSVTVGYKADTKGYVDEVADAVTASIPDAVMTVLKSLYYKSYTMRGLGKAESTTSIQVMFTLINPMGVTPTVSSISASVTGIGNVSAAVDSARTNADTVAFTLTSSSLTTNRAYICLVSFTLSEPS